MADRLKEIPAKILEWWNRFTTKQKTIIVGIVAGVIFTFAILIYIFSQTKYTVLGVYDDVKTASEVVEVLEEAGIAHRESADGLRVEVEAGEEGNANLALGAAGIATSMLSYSDYVNSGMSTTSTDRENQYKIYCEARATQVIENISAVKEAHVMLNFPPQNGTLAAEREDATAWIELDLQDTFTSANAANLAKAVATWLRNDNTANITIIDTEGNLLFAGGDDYGTYGLANSMQELQSQAEAMVSSQVTRVLMGTNQFNNITVAGHLNVDFASYEETRHEYYAPDGREEGQKANESHFTSTNTGGNAGIPGTDSNNETGYLTPDFAESSSETEEYQINYVPNEVIQKILTSPGVIDYPNSSIAISMIHIREVREEDAKRQGLLDGDISWEEYKLNNSEDKRLEVDPDLYAFVANATGIPQESISIIAYESVLCIDKERLNITGTTVLSGVMLLIILALLALVVLRSMGLRKATAEEEELSVENLLQSTPDSELEDIDVEAKSETRKLVEKFVDDNPEAAAALLRNWLSDDWG